MNSKTVFLPITFLAGLALFGTGYSAYQCPTGAEMLQKFQTASGNSLIKKSTINIGPVTVAADVSVPSAMTAAWFQTPASGGTIAVEFSHAEFNKVNPDSDAAYVGCSYTLTGSKYASVVAFSYRTQTKQLVPADPEQFSLHGMCFYTPATCQYNDSK